MIELTRLNGTVFFMNPDLLEIMEATPDTVILLTNGHRYVVRESPEEVVRRVVLFRKGIGSPPEGGEKSQDVL
ncbi:MAG: Flagellar protein (FlbD) [Synergistetes bacterium ADurb.Bin520]|jgi:flagellar protein FlbD|nr:MAG: Flagellar protein (FlbD) [Synergistetes bacterium ADurb.Bin520]